jgi:hypothetical protein
MFLLNNENVFIFIIFAVFEKESVVEKCLAEEDITL